MRAEFTVSRSLLARGVEARRRRGARGARSLVSQFLEVEPGNGEAWLMLAATEQRIGDIDAELTAVDEALKIDPRSLSAHLLKAQALERQGRLRRAADAYGVALQLAPPPERRPPELNAALQRAEVASRRVAAQRETFLRAHVARAYGRQKGEDLARFEEALEVALGKKAIYRRRPLLLFWPGLPEIQFYSRTMFPFLEEIEARFEDIRAEFLAAAAHGQGVAPYVDIPDTAPQDQWKTLNRTLRWGAYHLIKDGRPVEAHVARCPITAEALSLAPQPHVPGQNPVAMFSILEPHTRIPPHTGATNVRLVCHLPLIVPDGCGFRVGNETRAWVPGKAWVFDDTIEHEAWNDSDEPRAVLIFDIWNPFLTEAERELAATLLDGMHAFREDNTRPR
jgi:hypothetical protein